jgi:hypothetical protein
MAVRRAAKADREAMRDVTVVGDVSDWDNADDRC